jgi:cytochrome c-type biogenesis protein CcmE
MTDMTTVEPTQDDDLERKGRPWLWILVAAVVLISVGWVATSMLGQSVLYYRTPTEVVSQAHTQVRLAGTLVPDSVVADSGSGTTTFSVTDGKTKLKVIYTGSATTALTTAAQPGTQLVAEGSLGEDGQFHSVTLLAKCPSKFQTKNGASGAAQQ